MKIGRTRLSLSLTALGRTYSAKSDFVGPLSFGRTKSALGVWLVEGQLNDPHSI